MSILNVLGAELEYDFFDADQLELYERENKKVAEDIGDMGQYEGKSTADAIRMQCRIVGKFFDAVFGEGTAKKLFRGKANILEHMEAFGTVAQGANSARAEFEAIEDKYAPNRAERRQGEKDARRFNKQKSRNYYHNAAGHMGKGRNH